MLLEIGGSFYIAPIINYKSTQKYISDTNVVETYFETEEGSIRLMDAFAVIPKERQNMALYLEYFIIENTIN